MWICRTSPPTVLTGVSPFRCRIWGRTTQSWRVRSAIGVQVSSAPFSASTVHMQISPRPVATGPSVGFSPVGSWDAACCKRSATCCRAK
ncbi:hypothetical protein G6F56_014381 [Rhizopus delemar]|nr:hypothetical protein G6F56_014381 [Rhizopus delemar]